jgi:transposase-like protein
MSINPHDSFKGRQYPGEVIVPWVCWYIKVRGEDKYLYRALDSTGQTIDFLLTAKRDTAAGSQTFPAQGY